MKQVAWKARAWEWVAEFLEMVEDLFSYLASETAGLCYKAHLKAFEHTKNLDRGQNNGSRW